MMASRLGPSRLSNSSSDGSSALRGPVSKALPPLQVDRGFGDGKWGNFEVVVPDTNNTAATRSGRPEITRRSESILADRLNELSQLESPLLRELAQRLGAMLKIDTPRCHKKFNHPYADLHVGDRWEALQGCFGWKGLLEPNVDQVLKAEILRYGEFAQATYDAFDRDKKSKHYGTCKYLKTDLLEKVGLGNRGYEITNFLYATTNLSLFPHFLVGPAEDTQDSNEDDTVHSNEGSEQARAKCSVDGHGNSKDDNENSTNIEANSNQCENCSNENSRQCNWIGFVAVCTSPEEMARLGRRDIVIAWRGSVTTFDWIADMMDYMSPAGFGPDIASSSVRVEKGFLHLYTSRNPKSRYCQTKSARDQVHDAIRALVMKYKDKGKLSITLTGHSLGSALATMCAYDIAECQVDLLTPSVSSEWDPAESRHEVRGPEDDLSRHHPSSIFSKDASPIRASRRENEDRGERRGGISPGTPFKKFLSRQNQFVNKFRTDRVPVTVYSFGGPRVGNRAFVDRMEGLGVAVLRVVNVHDIVTKVPGLMRHLTKKLSQIVNHLPSYKHVGVKLKVDNELSDVLQKPAGLTRAHCLEGYLHLVDAYQGIVLDNNEKNFRERLLSSSYFWVTRSKLYKPYKKTFRDPALVNKYKDYLKPELSIPPCWRQEKNKGLVIKANGELGFPDRDETVPRTPPPKQEIEELDRNIDAACERSTPHQGFRRFISSTNDQ